MAPILFFYNVAARSAIPPFFTNVNIAFMTNGTQKVQDD